MSSKKFIKALAGLDKTLDRLLEGLDPKKSLFTKSSPAGMQPIRINQK